MICSAPEAEKKQVWPPVALPHEFLSIVKRSWYKNLCVCRNTVRSDMYNILFMMNYTHPWRDHAINRMYVDIDRFHSFVVTSSNLKNQPLHKVIFRALSSYQA